VREKSGGDEGKKWINAGKKDVSELFEYEEKGERQMKVNDGKTGKR
jgi:hypothetical protein